MAMVNAWCRYDGSWVICVLIEEIINEQFDRPIIATSPNRPDRAQAMAAHQDAQTVALWQLGSGLAGTTQSTDR